jgi:HD domain
MSVKLASSDAIENAVVAELPEIRSLSTPELQSKVVAVWRSFLVESTYPTISACPAIPGLPQYDLAGHTRHVVANCMFMADSLLQFWSIACDRDALLAAALTHDASKLVEQEGPNGAKSELGRALLHAQAAGVRCLEVGLPPKVAYMVTMHPYTPPHVHIKPQYVELVILTWADLGAADPLLFLGGEATHLEIRRRFFELG